VIYTYIYIYYHHINIKHTNKTVSWNNYTYNTVNKNKRIQMFTSIILKLSILHHHKACLFVLKPHMKLAMCNFLFHGKALFYQVSWSPATWRIKWSHWSAAYNMYTSTSQSKGQCHFWLSNCSIVQLNYSHLLGYRKKLTDKIN